VSLILEALKKLDREKQAPDRGVVVVGPSAWPSPREGLSALGGAGLVLAALVMGGAAGAMWLLRGPRTAESPAQGAVAAAPSQPTQASPASDRRPPLSAAIPAAKADPYRPVAKPKARPATAPGTAGPATTGEPAPAPPPAASAAEAEAPEARAVAEPPPSRPASHSGAADFQLQAISAQNGQPVAMLNDHLVREGDTFDDVRVVRIGADEVEIEVAGRRRIVKF
jgi:hypothetical protein